MIKLQFAFQGGGARLVPLIAAAEAVQNLTSERYTVSAVAGTSAGAIAAAALAQGFNIGEFRQKVLRHGKEDFPKIVKKFGLMSAGWKAWRGRTLYNAKAYKDFLDKIFAERFERPGIVSSPVLFLYSTDIRNGALRVMRREGVPRGLTHPVIHHDDLVQTVYRSSAIPFIFTTHKDNDPLVDGGLLRNFPTDDLVAQKDEFGDVLGFTFEPKQYQHNRGLFNYVGTIVGTSVDYGVKSSGLKLGFPNIHHLITGLGMLDFEEALVELDGKAYDQYYKSAEAFIKEYLRSKEPVTDGAEPIAPQVVSEPLRPDERSLDIIGRVVNLYDSLPNTRSVDIKRRTYRFTCKTLAQGKFDIKEHDDELLAQDEIIPRGEVLAYGCKLLSDGKLYDPRHITLSVVNKADRSRRVGATTLTLPPTHTPSLIYSNVMVFFHKALAPVKGATPEENTWILKYRCSAQEPLSYLLKEKYDRVAYQNEGECVVEKVVFLCDVPVEYANVVLNDIVHTKRPVEGKWATGRGRQLRSDELDEFDLSPPGFHLIGWEVLNVEPGESAGFEINV